MHYRTRRHDIDVISHQAEVLKCYAHFDSEREWVDLSIEEMRRVNASKDEIVRTLAGYVYDGLAYGNWPWITTYMA